MQLPDMKGEMRFQDTIAFVTVQQTNLAPLNEERNLIAEKTHAHETSICLLENLGHLPLKT